jgi:hypothetical protein
MSENVGSITGDETFSQRRLFDRPDSLPHILEYTGEFGPELVLFLPFCNWLSGVGLLKGRRILTYTGMSCFYNELDCVEIQEKSHRRVFLPPQDRPKWLPVRNEHNFDNSGRSPLHLYPDLRQKFRSLPLIPDVESTNRPLLIIHNKYNNEWSLGPVNYIPLATLDTIFRVLKQDFTIVYTRHGMGGAGPGYTEDHNDPSPFEDRALLFNHPEVLCFDDLYAAHVSQCGAQDINTFKNVLYSRCHRFVSSQGGGAHHIAMFSGSILVVLHRSGSEERWAYGNGYYGFMAPVPPIRAICRTDDDLIRSLSLFANSTVVDDRLLLSAGSETRLAQLSPWTIANRRPEPAGSRR